MIFFKWFERPTYPYIYIKLIGFKNNKIFITKPIKAKYSLDNLKINSVYIYDGDNEFHVTAVNIYRNNMPLQNKVFEQSCILRNGDSICLSHDLILE